MVVRTKRQAIFRFMISCDDCYTDPRMPMTESLLLSDRLIYSSAIMLVCMLQHGGQQSDP
jgi:hypothetical protein